MTLSFGNYEESYPPEILRGYEAPPLVGGAVRRASASEPTAPPSAPGPESNAPEGAVPVESTRTEPDGPAVVAVPADQLDEAAAEAEPTPTVRAPSVRETAIDEQRSNAERTGAGEQLENTGTEFTVTAGTPGTYEPAVSASERPRNVTELRGRARPATGEPWPEGAYVLVGTTGKRAHWTGADWHGDESPGYGEPADDDLDAEPEVDEIGDAAAEEAQAEADANGDR